MIVKAARQIEDLLADPDGVTSRCGAQLLQRACAAWGPAWAAVFRLRLPRHLLESGDTADANASDEDDPAGVQLLLKHKAKVDARDRDGRGALHAAAFQGHADILAALLDAGADVQARDAREATPLLEAARGGRANTFEALRSAGAELGARDADGRNALLLACVADTPSSALVSRLLELGVDAQAAGRDGKRLSISRQHRIHPVRRRH